LGVLPCSVEHGLFCDEAWAAIGKELGISPCLAEVARRVVAGQGDRQIAQALGLTWQTVQTYTKRLYLALKIHSRVELATLICAAYRAWRAESAPPKGCPEIWTIDRFSRCDKLSSNSANATRDEGKKPQ
jgi:hypothetical protein